MTLPRVLIVAGSDPSGGAGLQADIKTAHAFGCYAMAAVTALTVQDTRRVHRIHPVPPGIVAEEIEACLADIGADAIKVGMLGGPALVKAVAAVLKKRARKIPIVLDPVMASTSGKPFLGASATAALKKDLLPLATLVTPNIPEARALSGVRDPVAAARKLHAQGARAVLVKGGHAARTDATVDDILVWEMGEEILAFPRIETKHTHGTGCTLSTAIACGLARGLPLGVAVGKAREFVQAAIATAPGLGRGRGPLNHFARQ